MMNYLKKFALEILPSVAATVIGAYIVNHYISKPAADSPTASINAGIPAKKTGVKPADVSADAVAVPEPGVKAKGISERAMIEKSASERPAEFKPTEKPAESKPTDNKPTDTASLPADPRRRPPTPALAPKVVAKTAPAPVPSASPVAPPEAATATAPAAADDHRDANDLARAAIERLRGDSQPRTQEAARSPEAPRLQEAPRTVTPPATASVRPLPPPITVATPPVDTTASAPSRTAAVDPNRPVPPADIPLPPPIDLRADARKVATHTTNVAEDMLAATKSMFHAILPGSNGRDGQSSSASQFTD